jgi:hypothetical protein
MTDVKKFLFRDLPADAPVSAEEIETRLLRYVDRPTRHGARVLVLRRGRDEAGALEFWVEEMPVL